MFLMEKRRRPPGRDTSRVRTGSLKGTKKDGFGSVRWSHAALAVTTFVVVTALLGVVEPAFPFLEGEVVDREIRLRIDVDIFNETKTRNSQEEAARHSPLVFIHNPQPNIDLLKRLVELAAAAAKQGDFDMLPGSLRAQWKDLTAELFSGLRTIVPVEESVPDFEGKINEVFKPILEYGVLQEMPDKVRERTLIEIYTVGDPEPKAKSQDDVLMPNITRQDGLLRTRLMDQFRNEAGVNSLFALIVPNLKSTLTFDEPRSQKAEERYRQQVLNVFDKYKAGDLVVPQGQRITEEQLRLLEAEHKKWVSHLPTSRKLSRLAGTAFLVFATMLAVAAYLRIYGRRFASQTGGLVAVAIIGTVTIVLAELLRPAPFHAEVLPVTVAALLLTVAYSRSFALAITFCLSLLVSLLQLGSFQSFVVMAGGASVGIVVLDSVRSRTKLIAVGLYCGLAFACLRTALGLLYSEPAGLVFDSAIRQFGCGLISGFLVSGSLPFIESLFGIVTDISLLELADTSHPLLQELVRRAPGTYNHSVTVSMIGEAAAKQVGCNSLLVRVGALFHDVGKMLKPHYFVENFVQNSENRHDRLEPAMSTLIIIGHVKDGVDLGQQHHLPQPILDMIEQHHGTTLVDYFYHEATLERNVSPHQDEEVEESAFRYPGPMPQSKEAAVLMLADCVESASRSLSEPTPARIEKLVSNLAMKRLLDGQFNECGLTFLELKMIQDSLTKSLLSVYHGRIKYPVAV